ncbi:MAG: magnesium transporter [Syntrophales bacterium]|nr:magnesium transporter [Syntrophales bacterium]
MKSFELFKPEIEEMIEGRRWQELQELLPDLPGPDLADLLVEIGERKRIVILRLLPRDLLPEVFSYLDASVKEDILKALTDEETRVILAGLTPDDRTDFLEELPGQAIQKVLNLLTFEDRHEALQLLGYPAESVGRLMTPDYVAVHPEWTVGQALDQIREKGMDSETINVIYVTNILEKLIGVMGLRRLILAKPDERVEQVMEDTIISISALADREEAVQKIRRYDIVALPVVDAGGILLGIVTIDDLFDVAEEEVTEDFQKSAAVNPLKTSYRESSILSLYGKRVIWLAALLGISVITTNIISSQVETLASAIALAFFIPLLIGTGGNTGAQSSTLMIRAMATGDIRDRQWVGAVMREIGIGCLLGVTMGAASWVLGFFRGNWQIALIVSLAMFAIVCTSSILGVILPLVLQRFRVDPAVASNPLIASIMDIIGLAIYFSIAAVILNMA